MLCFMLRFLRSTTLTPTWEIKPNKVPFRQGSEGGVSQSVSLPVAMPCHAMPCHAKKENGQVLNSDNSDVKDCEPQ
jgi:hypothetical protein